MTADITCDFCGKDQDQVETLLAGPGRNGEQVYICNECVSLGHRIVSQGLPSHPKPDAALTPKAIKAALDEYIIGQEYAKMVLSVCAYNHHKRVTNPATKFEKSNVLLVGASGTGKTLIAQTLSRIMDVPFAITDATTLTESGYVGDDVDAVIERLLIRSDYDVEAAQGGVVFIDEIDKKRRTSEGNTATRDVSGEGVQQALLRLIEGSELRVKITKPGGKEDVIDFDTSNVLFILGGAFVGIEEIISRRTQTTVMGFDVGRPAPPAPSGVMAVRHQDVIEYGLIPEIVGRLPLVVPLEPLSAQELVDVMKNSKASAKSQYITMLKQDGINLEFSDEFLLDVAERCVASGQGARGIRSLLEEALISVMYRAPDLTASGVSRVVFEKYPSDLSTPPSLCDGDQCWPDSEYQFPRHTTPQVAVNETPCD
jgi:ATP-dependent Clp protease ATP-binding subunit ClpX